MTKEIPLTKGFFAIVDDEDWEGLTRTKWFAAPNNGNSCYAARHIRGGPQRTIFMHRAIIEAPEGLFVDHINHNSLDNRRCNLRLATHAQNMYNCPYPNTSGYRGVSWHKQCGKWQVGIKKDGVRRNLGLFTDIREAASAYDASAKVLFGEYAILNFPEDRDEAA